ncbi:hypothetical protein ACFLVS_03285 [Chloroflexota bacterium]
MAKLNEAKILIKQCRKEYNQVRAHSLSGYHTAAPEAIILLILTEKWIE